MLAKHNDREKDPISLKRAPLNNDIIEELEHIRTNYQGKAQDVEALSQLRRGLHRFLEDVNLPIFDR